METITLECWVYRDIVGNIFPVKISGTETVGFLKQLIKAQKFNRFRNVEADKLQLYTILIPLGDDDSDESIRARLKQLSLEGKSCLDPLTKVSELFPESDEGEEEWLIVVDGPDSGSSITEPVAPVPDMTLRCWVRGQGSTDVFTVKIPSTETVEVLKEVIENKRNLRDINANALTLYRVSLPYGDDDSLEDMLGTLTISSLGKPLWVFKKLSAIFISPPADNQLHLIVDGLPLSLQCWIRGAELDNCFAVQISTRASVGELKNAIKAAYSNDLSPGHMKLYKISVNEEAELRKCLRALGSGQLLLGIELVEKVFDDVPFSQLPRIIVEPSSERPTLTGSVTSIKREHLDDPFEVNKRIRRDFATLPTQTPSMIAMPSSFLAHYQKKRKSHIRCGRPQENQSPFPLVLAHPIFATFVSECETYEPSDEDLKLILELSLCMRQFFGDEKDRRTQFRACMRRYYGISLTESKIEGTEYMTDGDARVGILPYLMLSEAKKDFGASKGDPYIQAAAYHLAATQSQLRTYPDDLRALPCIHIFYNGPVVGFAGSMLTEEFDVNVLGPILPLFYHRTDIDSQIRCAKMFGALKNAATALKEYYEHTKPQSLVDTRFPWITQYDTITTPTETREYEYISRMDSDSLLYICQHTHDKKRILVKFVPSRIYSKDAHLASAAKDGAPTLLGHCNVLSCGWTVVVMELLEGPDWVSGLKIGDMAEQRMVRDKVREHVLILHQQGFVHGDVRPQNVFVKRPDTGNGHTLSVRLVDFDWAGEINKAKYPFLVNPDLGYGFRRPSSVKGGGIITMEHDLAMVGLMYPFLDETQDA